MTVYLRYAPLSAPALSTAHRLTTRQDVYKRQTLYHDCLANLEESNHGWVNDPTSAINLQLNELIEHIATFALNYKIKYNEDNKLIEQIDEYLDDTFMLFSSYGINMQDLQKWRKSGNRLFRCFVNATKENRASLSC